MQETEIVLLPPPRLLRCETGQLVLKQGFGIVCQGKPAALLPVAEQLQQDIHQILGMESFVLSGPAGKDDLCQVTIRFVEAGKVPPQGYQLRISRSHIFVESSDTAGAFYAVMTIRQLMRAFGDRLHACRIEDHPAFPTRGLMLDISRDKVPTMATLYALIDQMAEWKLNQLQLYTEHTFAYSRHEDVWRDASPMTADEIRDLDVRCRERFIELVPNQNSFGHFQRWLKLPRYQELAECTGEFSTPWRERRTGPASLNPLHPGSLALLDELYAELLPNFTSNKFNVGCDETFDLGQGASRTECERLGKGQVYLDYLLKIQGLTEKYDRRMLFWGDIVLNHEDLIPKIPRDITALIWGYEANHPFDVQCNRFAAAEIPFYVCPGTSTWNSIGGRTDNALANLASAAECGIKHGAAGYLITDWGDNGHWQPLPVSFLPCAAGASLAWTGKVELDQLLAALDLHTLRDKGHEAARAIHDLGNAYARLKTRIHNESPLFRLLYNDEIQPLLAKLQGENFSEVGDFVRAAAQKFDQAKIKRADAELIKREIQLAANMMLAGCSRANNPAETLSPDLVEEFKDVWLLRNRPGGLSDSIKPLQRRAGGGQ